ncbi:acyl-CoA dehydrogenase family protein [Nocardia goodfellowii]|uniref:Alkylation response protein AidB-like acyl-CoA dehydrogenase n=1 Tax=Nocardia goodfellowii TaxID=882446 RepID=A0ABS4QJZ1_9NOCA|nr:acyl-CoA dehydrogenase family protein [Nocardia goodfellowii]MBP2192016.1 alkylation response protein AidB-like acyl-CoA dehydrogenase [Nocardia goodfellowii]
MDFEMGEAAARLRGELRRLVAAEVPADYLGAFTDDPADLAVAQHFCRALADRGLLCPAWPAEYGGRDASVWEQTVVREEMWAHHEPRGAQYMGVNWVGPALMRHGTVDQRRKHLPSIARGEVIWCQGFSEPDSGSDLASLRTAARPDGDGWSISGQKIWTSYAQLAQWCFLLARTSKAERKQQGLTVFLLPMSSPGLEVRPIRSMLGPHHLNEVFFDGVRATEADVLGRVGDGWQVVREVLAFERVGIARYARCERLLHAAPRVLGESRWAQLVPQLRGRWSRMLVHCRRARLLAYQVVALQDAGQVAPGDAAAYRIAVTRLDQDSAAVLAEIAAAAPEDEPGRRYRRAVADHWRYAQASTVASGSIEMQRILLSRTLLEAA